ncbi:DUF2867 domain-containing protein [Streptomyces rectiviolaceus]|uniref:DUF2867 domain-containing protein n=1 Tax=Streptomyces rectiviolaceus TaxID=332591 RepID=A0ABP6MDH6_9ACTN
MSTVLNEHERVIKAPAEVVGALLDRLSAEDDPLFPTPAWAAMIFDRPLGVGATGGHGPVRYSVTEYEPGHRVRFDFTPPDNGFHELSVEPIGERRCRVRHVLETRPHGKDRLLWSAVVRPLHDTIIEEVFDNIERAATGGCARPVRWSPRVRLYNRLMWSRPETVGVPESAHLIRTAVDRPGYEDAYRMELLPGQPRDPEAWTGILRDAFPVIDRDGDELLLEVEARGLTARASILVDERYVTLSSTVRADTLRGRIYWGVVKQAHPFMARMMLRRTHRRLALATPSAGERELERRRSAVSGPSHLVSG